MTRGVGTAAVVLLALWMLAVSQPALAATPAGQAETRARVLFAQGNELVRSKDYAAALAKFRAAYALFPSPKILLNTGTTLQLLGRMAEAADTYEKYLHDPHAEPARLQQVTALVAELDQQVGHLHITVDVPRADVFIDGVLVGEAAPTLSRRVDAGDHTLSARSGVRQTPTRVVSLAPGVAREVTLRFVLQHEATENVARLPPTPTHAANGPPAWLAPVVTGAAAVAGATGLYFGVRVLDSHVGYRAASLDARGANISFAVAGVVALGAAALWYWALQAPSQPSH